MKDTHKLNAQDSEELPVADPGLQIRGGGVGGAGHPDSKIRSGGSLKK